MSSSEPPQLVIRNGLIVDGSGAAAYRGDIAVMNGRIATIGEVNARGVEEIDATGKIVTPGFVDLHTHYDGQAVWSDTFSPSSSHGVTTVLMGNCGVGFAPCRREDHDRLVCMMEGVEDIPEVVMTEGLDWSWETFPQFLDTIESRPHDIDFAAYVPHSPIRVYVMGQRGADREPASHDDLRRMEELALEALNVGAIGFSTSSIPAHLTGEGQYVPSFKADEEENQAMARALRRSGGRVFQMVLDPRAAADAENLVPMLTRISKTSGGTVTFTLVQVDTHPTLWRDVLDAVAKANEEDGVDIRPQVFPRPIGVLLGHELSLNPFSGCPTYERLRDLTLDDKLVALRDPAVKAALISEEAADPDNPTFKIVRDFARQYRFETAADYEPIVNVVEEARAAGRPLLDYVYDLLLEDDGHAMMLATITNYADRNLDSVRDMITFPGAVVALGDGGAHYGLICDASFPTFMLSHWTRDRASGRFSVEEAVRKLTVEPAQLAGLLDRGLLQPGYKADINIIDYDALQLKMPEVNYDLPGGGRRLNQQASGYVATIVSGRVARRDGRSTGDFPGRLVRGTQPAPAAH